MFFARLRRLLLDNTARDLWPDTDEWNAHRLLTKERTEQQVFRDQEDYFSRGWKICSCKGMENCVGPHAERKREIARWLKKQNSSWLQLFVLQRQKHVTPEWAWVQLGQVLRSMESGDFLHLSLWVILFFPTERNNQFNAWEVISSDCKRPHPLENCSRWNQNVTTATAMTRLKKY